MKILGFLNHFSKTTNILHIFCVCIDEAIIFLAIMHGMCYNESRKDPEVQNHAFL